MQGICKLQGVDSDGTLAGALKMRLAHTCFAIATVLAALFLGSVAFAQQPDFLDQASANANCKAEHDRQIPSIAEICWEGSNKNCLCGLSGTLGSTGVCSVTLVYERYPGVFGNAGHTGDDVCAGCHDGGLAP